MSIDISPILQQLFGTFTSLLPQIIQLLIMVLIIRLVIGAFTPVGAAKKKHKKRGE